LTTGFPPTSTRPAPKTGGFALRLVAWEVKPLRIPRKMDDGPTMDQCRSLIALSALRGKVPTKQDYVMITDQDLATSLLLTLKTVPNSWAFDNMAIDVWLWSFGENTWKESVTKTS
jgi:hypothetical protein